jgi:thiamine biosynthesis lipoprotein
MRAPHGLALLAVLAAGTPPAAPATCEETVVRRSRPMMATLVSVTARGCDAAVLEARIGEAFAEMERLAAILSEWSPDSAVSKVNARAGLEAVPIPPELREVLQAALEAAALTAGAFDPTWAALADLWRFDGGPPRLPAPAEVERRRKLVDYRDLVLAPESGTAFLRRQGMRLGLGGLAKGYIAAAAADLLVSRGVAHVLVAASGDIAARGRNGTRPWTVAVRDPRAPRGALATVELADESISTAGGYERSFEVGGRRYHHILDPKTGYPARGSESVTVIAPRGVVADALDTGLFVLGATRGLPLVESLPGVAALFVDPRGRVRLSRAARARFRLRSAAAAGPADVAIP